MKPPPGSTGTKEDRFAVEKGILLLMVIIAAIYWGLRLIGFDDHSAKAFMGGSVLGAVITHFYYEFI